MPVRERQEIQEVLWGVSPTPFQPGAAMKRMQTELLPVRMTAATATGARAVEQTVVPPEDAEGAADASAQGTSAA